jgi:divalent metal cation (Fe/Co/Zn/Cd) transporter
VQVSFYTLDQYFVDGSLALKVARARNSAILASNAVHHRVDSLTAMAALISIAASNMFPSLVALDPLAALVISGMVVRAGTTNLWTSFSELADQAVTSESRLERVRQAAQHAITSLSGDSPSQTQQLQISSVRGIKSGQNFIWEIRIVAPNDATVWELGSLEGGIRQRVAEKVSGTRMVRVRWVAEGLEAERAKFEEWVPEKEGQDSPVENGSANGNGNGHSHHNHKKE